MRDGDDAGRALVERAAQLHEAQGDVDRAAENYVVLAEADRRRQQLGPALRNVQKALALYESQRLRAVNPDLRATYLANRAEAAELQGELYMTLWDRATSARREGAAGERGTARCRVQPAARARGLPQSRRRRRPRCCERRACARRAAVGKAAPSRDSAGATKPASRNNRRTCATRSVCYVRRSTSLRRGRSTRRPIRRAGATRVGR